jgi:hypothetical protein
MKHVAWHAAQVALALLCACRESPLPEGEKELDPPGDDSGIQVGEEELDSEFPDTGEAGGNEEVEPETTGGQVCYPGPEWDWDVCFGLVGWSSDWDGYGYPEPYQGSPQYAAPLRFIDLSAEEPSAALSPNFVLSEFMQERKGRFSLFQVHALETLQELREATGGPLNINSGYRNVAYNEGVGGVTHSRHMYGDAADMYSSVVTLEELGSLCDGLDASYVGYYETHVHCDWRNEPLDPAFFGSGRGPGIVDVPEHGAELLRQNSVWTAPARGFDEGEPLRRWRALDSEGEIIAERLGRSFLPPEASASIEVWIGGQVQLREEL